MGLLQGIERWWSRLVNDPQGPAQRPATWRKHGCGMDPNGERICGPGTSPGAQPAATGGSDLS